MKKSIAIIGGGPAALTLAAFLDEHKFDVTIYEQNATLGRKFLVAGKGGFNLTHSEPINNMIDRYTPTSFLQASLLSFTNVDLRVWLEKIGVPTFIGSSKRIYPEKGIKPIEVLNSIIVLLKNKGVSFKFNHSWTGWTDNNSLVFNNDQVVEANFTVFSMGGGSWKVTGSNGKWLNTFSDKGISTLPFTPANCAYQINWPDDFITKNEGSPLKNISLSCEHKMQKGELVITKLGLEGNAIYALSPQIQHQLSTNGEAIIHLDLKPTLTDADVLLKISATGIKTSKLLRETLRLTTSQIDLIKFNLSKEAFLNPKILANTIKNLPLKITGSASLDEAISTSGGIALDAVNSQFELNKLENQFCIGEMLDWNAPTGGYLLQACFSMGVYLANSLNRK